jgi:hypothetical protein
MTQLSFDEEHRYKDDEEGIPISVILTYGDRTVRTDAKVDPGSTVCLFSHEDGLDLGVPLSKAFRSHSAA